MSRSFAKCPAGYLVNVQVTNSHTPPHRHWINHAEKTNKPDVSATEASECSILSIEEQQLHCVAAEVDVMIRTAFVEFLFNPEILSCVDQCLCIFRLFPRPVVSLRPSTFMATYQKNFLVYYIII